MYVSYDEGLASAGPSIQGDAMAENERQEPKPLEHYFPKLDPRGRPVVDVRTLDKIIPSSNKLNMIRRIMAVIASDS